MLFSYFRVTHLSGSFCETCELNVSNAYTRGELLEFSQQSIRKPPPSSYHDPKYGISVFTLQSQHFGEHKRKRLLDLL